MNHRPSASPRRVERHVPASARNAARNLLSRSDINLRRFSVVGPYVRYNEGVRNYLKDGSGRIERDLYRAIARPQNHLVYAPSGAGKTSLINAIAEANQGHIRYVPITLDGTTSAGDLSLKLQPLFDADARPTLCLLDEIELASSCYGVILRALDVNVKASAHVVTVLAGSSGRTMEAFERIIADAHKGSDILSRTNHRLSIPPLEICDRPLVFLASVAAAAGSQQKLVAEVERFLLFYVALDVYGQFTTCRALDEHAHETVSRLAQHESRLLYDHQFDFGDDRGHEFWDKHHEPSFIGTHLFVHDLGGH